MKNKVSQKYKVALCIILSVLAFIGINYLFDYVFNGVLVDWFDNNYMRTVHKTDPTGVEIYFTSPYYEKIKLLMIEIGIVIIILFIVLIYFIVNHYTKKKEQDTIMAIDSMIHTYMNHDIECNVVFPKQYAPIAAQMVEIKSSREHSEQNLKDEARRKNDLITYLAHDLKTPLTSVIGYLSLLDEVPEMPIEQKAKYVGIALDKANRLEKLINEFFEITRYNLQQIVLEKETIDLKYMLIQMSDEFYPILSSHQNTIELNIEDNLMALVDPDKLARVFNNIIKNAVAYSYPNTKIKIEAKNKDNDIEIKFMNKGKTIPKEKLNMIFDKFFRVDSSRGTNKGGAGLGLAIAKQIVELHGGTINAYSENEETTFKVILPQN